MTESSRRAVVAGLTLVVALLVTGCAGSPASPQIATAQSPHAVASPGASTSSTPLQAYVEAQQRWVDCMRDNGLKSLPDPDQLGQVLMKASDRPAPDVMMKADRACRKFQEPVPEEVAKLRDDAYAANLSDAEKKVFRDYATCMQRNGAPDFPDPQPNGVPGDGEWDETSPGAGHASSVCAPIIGDPTTQGPGVG